MSLDPDKVSEEIHQLSDNVTDIIRDVGYNEETLNLVNSEIQRIATIINDVLEKVNSMIILFSTVHKDELTKFVEGDKKGAS